jgi:hypothetical protein
MCGLTTRPMDSSFPSQASRCSVCTKHRRVFGLENDHGFLSYGTRAKAKRRHADYSFLFMRAKGGQLTEIASLVDDGIIRPVVGRVFAFASTRKAMTSVEAGRAKGILVGTPLRLKNLTKLAEFHFIQIRHGPERHSVMRPAPETKPAK